ncbi:hypothetical protein, partial [Treponema endosymbiont of Eucomonympha sp.]|uniref:hypothetical protein n=1 Tax=Treponema endosymbiont of Eucomonympha sp. TaxID=1580831 RepID=UPI000AB3F981
KRLWQVRQIWELRSGQNPAYPGEKDAKLLQSWGVTVRSWETVGDDNGAPGERYGQLDGTVERLTVTPRSLLYWGNKAQGNRWSD